FEAARFPPVPKFQLGNKVEVYFPSPWGRGLRGGGCNSLTYVDFITLTSTLSHQWRGDFLTFPLVPKPELGNERKRSSL
ncbi:MAG: hypothetical protein SWC40_00660, partial [Thermodesulfobacteriota bacterium]|nr:hypothetical protein [Thermodesulfobacteriota bacterium]